MKKLKSNKQRRAEIKQHRVKAAAKKVQRLQHEQTQKILPVNVVACDANALGVYNSYGVPAFVERGYYVDTAFTCKDCGKQEIWTAAQQKWWYEIAKGYVYSFAVRCRECRKLKRAQKQQAKRLKTFI